jgi:predicted SAM-dependent methyltransferase
MSWLILSLKSIVKFLHSLVLMAGSWLGVHLGRFTARQLEIGSGPVRKTGWITLDHCRGADVYWDLRRGLPFKEASFERVYSSHVLEHFSYRDMQNLLREVLRVLKPGGVFSICVPDASIYVQAYLGQRSTGDLDFYKPALVSQMRMDLLNYIFYMDGHHRFMFDRENLTYHCKEAGFVDCQPREFDPSVDMIERAAESIHFICRRPE